MHGFVLFIKPCCRVAQNRFIFWTCSLFGMLVTGLIAFGGVNSLHRFLGCATSVQARSADRLGNCCIIRIASCLAMSWLHGYVLAEACHAKKMCVVPCHTHLVSCPVKIYGFGTQTKCVYWGTVAPQTPCCSLGDFHAASRTLPVQIVRGSASQALFVW